MSILVEKICKYEEGKMNNDEIISFFQELVSSGVAWTLHGHYGRTAMNLIEEGLVTPP